MGKTPRQRLHCISVGWPLSGARSPQVGHTAYFEPQLIGMLIASLGRGTTDQRCGRVGTIWTEARGRLTERSPIWMTASSAVTRTTSCHAPRRAPKFTSPRTRAHCGTSGIVAFRALGPLLDS